MKHGIKLRKLQRTSSHRQALLRNLVSALLHHETIKTTVPKAKEAARMAEKIISLGKKGTNPSVSKAQAYLYAPHHYAESSVPQQKEPLPPPGLEGDLPPPKTLLHKVFNTLAERYAERPGGYTRIMKFGKRPGDNAPVAIVSLVDGPRDVKFEMTARTIAREATVLTRVGDKDGVKGSAAVPRDFKGSSPLTIRNVEKVLKYRGPEGVKEFEKLSKHFNALLVSEQLTTGHRRPVEEKPLSFRAHSLSKPHEGRRVLSGERFPGVAPTHTGLGLARGELGGSRLNRKLTQGDDARPRFAVEMFPEELEEHIGARVEFK